MENIRWNYNLNPVPSSSDGGRLQQHSENDVPIARPTTLFLPSALQGELGRRRNSSTLDEASSIVRVTNGFSASSIRVLRANSVPLMSTLPCLPAVASAVYSSCQRSPSSQTARAQHLSCNPSNEDRPTSGGLQPVACLTTNGLRQATYITTASLTPITPSQPTTLTSLLPGPAVVSPSSGDTRMADRHNPTDTQHTASLLDHPIATLNNQTTVISQPESLSQNQSGSNNFLTNRSVLYNEASSNFLFVNNVAPPISLTSIGYSQPILSCPPNTLTPVTPTADIAVLSPQKYQDLVSSQSLNSDFVYMQQPGGNVIEINKFLLSQYQERLQAKQVISPLAQLDNDFRHIIYQRKNSLLHSVTADESTPSQNRTETDHCIGSKILPQVGPQGSSTDKCLEWLKISTASRTTASPVTTTASSTVRQRSDREVGRFANVSDTKQEECPALYVPLPTSVVHCSLNNEFAPSGASALAPCVGRRPILNHASPSIPPPSPYGTPATVLDNGETRNVLSSYAQKTFDIFYELNPPASPEPVSLLQLRSNSFPVFNGNKSSTVSTSSELRRSPSISSLDRIRCWSNFLQTELTPNDTNANSTKNSGSTAGTYNDITERCSHDTGLAPSSLPNLVALPASSPMAGYLGVDLRLTMPCSPPVPESGDETAFSFQDCETATLHDSDLDSVDSDSSIDVASRAGKGDSEGRDSTAADDATTPPEHFVIGGVLTDGDFDGASSVVLEDEPIFDEYEPVSDLDETAVVELSDSDIDAGFAVTAAALAAAEADSQLSDEFADQSAMDSDDGVDTDELDMAGFLIAFGRKEKRRRRDGSRKGISSSLLEASDGLVVCREASQCRMSSGCSDSDHDLLPADRWRCLECNQLNNKSFFRYCEKCWKMRRGWLPDPPKKRRKRKPRNRAPRRRTTSTKASDAPTPDKDATKGPSVAAGTSRQAVDGGESSMSSTITLDAAGLVSRKGPSGSPGTSHQANETCGMAEEIGSVSPKVRMREQVIQGDTKETEQTRTTATECSTGKSLGGTTAGHHSRVVVESRPCSGLDDPSVATGVDLSNALPVNSKLLNESCVSIEPSISREETASNGISTKAGVKVVKIDDLVNYNLGIDSCNGLSNTCPSKMDHDSETVHTQADGAIKVEYLKNSAAAGPSADNSKAQFSQSLVTANFSFDSLDMIHREDAVDGATSNDLKRTSICGDVQESGFKSDGLAPVSDPSAFGQRSCVDYRLEATGVPLRRLSLNACSSSVDNSFERASIHSIVEGSCRPVSFPLSPQPPNVSVKFSSSSRPNVNKQPTSALSESHLRNRLISESMMGNFINSVLCASAFENSAGLSIANGKISLGAGEVPGEVCSAGETLKRSLSTASTVSANNSFHLEHESDSASTEDESAYVGNEHHGQTSLTSMLKHNTLMSIKQHVDGIDAPKELPGCSPAPVEFECKSLLSDEHHVADLDRFSTHSATDSVQSAIDSGLGSSQDLFQDSPLGNFDVDHNGDDLPASSSASRHPSKTESSKVDLRRRNKTSVYSKKVSHWKGEKSVRKRSNPNSAVLEIVDVYIENISSESESSSKLTDRITKRKYSRDSPCKRSPSVKRARKDNSPLKSYLTDGLLLNSDEVDVTSLPLSHSTRIISSAIADFLRSADSHSWLATDVGRSWVSSDSVQAMMLASLTGGGGRSGEAEGKGGSASVDVRTENLCIMCQDRPKDAAIIHGKTSHQTTCYKCAKTLFARKQRCPVCRRKILRISKNIIV